MGNQKSALPYDIGDEDHSFPNIGRTGWRLFKGVKKEDGSRVSVLKFEKSSLVSHQSINESLMICSALLCSADCTSTLKLLIVETC